MKTWLGTDDRGITIVVQFDDNNAAEAALRKTLLAQAANAKYEIFNAGGYANSAGVSLSNVEIRQVKTRADRLSASPFWRRVRESLRLTS